MRVHFYKLHIGGNGFILIDLSENKAILPPQYANISKTVCDRRYGTGGSSCLFLSADNTLRFFLPSGEECSDSYDGLLCASRYAFDSGRISKDKNNDNSIVFKTMRGDRALKILSFREFKIALGTPFSLTSGKIINQNSKGTIETFDVEEKSVCVSGFHIHSDIISAHPNVSSAASFYEFYTKIRKVFSKKRVYLVFSRCITREILSIRTIKRGPSTSTASAAAALVSSVLSGASETAAVCVFEKGNPSLDIQQSKLAEDTDNSRKLTIIWENDSNEIYAIGSGGYLFEGFFDIRGSA